jgi:hypothetical protein
MRLSEKRKEARPSSSIGDNPEDDRAQASDKRKEPRPSSSKGDPAEARGGGGAAGGADAVHKKRGPKPRQDALMQRPTVARLSDNDVWGTLDSPPIFLLDVHIYL